MITFTTLVFAFCLWLFFLLPSVVTLPFVILAAFFLLTRGYYLESLAVMAMLRSMGWWATGNAAPYIDYLKFPLLMLLLYSFLMFAGRLNRIPNRLIKTASVTFFPLLILCFFSEEVILSILKLIGVYVGYLSVMAISLSQKRILKSFVPVLVLGMFLANAANKFSYFLPNMYDPSIFSDLYTGIWVHSQTAGVLYGFLLLWILTVRVRPKWLESVMIIILLPLLFMTKCRTAMIGLTLILLTVFKNWRIKVFIILVAAVMMLTTPQFFDEVFSKRGKANLDSVGGFITSLYDTRISVIEKTINSLSLRTVIVGGGLGIGSYTFIGKYEATVNEKKYQKIRRERLEERIKNATVEFMGFSFITSFPVEYGNIITGMLGDVGVIGTALFVFFFFTYYQVISPAEKTLFSYIILINMAEAILLSPTGNTALLFMLCLMMKARNAPLVGQFLPPGLVSKSDEDDPGLPVPEDGREG